MTTAYAACAVEHMRSDPSEAATRLSAKLEGVTALLVRAIDQTRRRVINGESVPATEKIVSLFEPHTDVIVKDHRDTYYGHKIFLTGGKSGLILDCAVVKGNPADSTWSTSMLRRHQRLFGSAPRQASLDGGFASTDNLRQAKTLGVVDLCFAKRRGLAVLDMVKSSWVYRKLRAFRAGIESVISWLKRSFGLDRCIWKGPESFVAYVRLAVLTANLLLLARHRLA